MAEAGFVVGSLATGDFDLDSDVDFLVVMESDLNEHEVPLITDIHKRTFEQYCYPAKHLEGSYLPLHVLNDCEMVGKTPVWYVDNGSTTLEQNTHDNRWHVRWTLRERGIAILGPNPKELFPSVPPDRMKHEVRDAMTSMERSCEDALDGPLSYFNSRY